jgi:hypothetical protein
MSRSRRKTKAIKICGGDSDKKDKQLANRAFRRLSKMRVQKVVMSDEDDVNIPVDMDEVSNVYSFSSDGGAYYREDLDEKFMRK